MYLFTFHCFRLLFLTWFGFLECIILYLVPKVVILACKMKPKWASAERLQTETKALKVYLQTDLLHIPSNRPFSSKDLELLSAASLPALLEMSKHDPQEKFWNLIISHYKMGNLLCKIWNSLFKSLNSWNRLLLLSSFCICWLHNNTHKRLLRQIEHLRSIMQNFLNTFVSYRSTVQTQGAVLATFCTPAVKIWFHVLEEGREGANFENFIS